MDTVLISIWFCSLSCSQQMTAVVEVEGMRSLEPPPICQKYKAHPTLDARFFFFCEVLDPDPESENCKHN